MSARIFPVCDLLSLEQPWPEAPLEPLHVEPELDTPPLLLETRGALADRLARGALGGDAAPPSNDRAAVARGAAAGEAPTSVGGWSGRHRGSRDVVGPEEERELGRRIAAARCLHAPGTAAPRVATPAWREILERGEQAKQHLLAANLRLVVHIAQPYQYLSELPLPDLVQEGTLGLLRAVETFDVTTGYRFATYAGAWIRRSIGNAIVDRGTTIRLPRHAADDVRRFKRAWRALAHHAADQGPTIDALAVALAWTLDKTRGIAALAQAEVVSLDAVVDTDTGRALQHDLAAETPGPEAVYMHAETLALLAQALQSLPARQQAIIRLRFGFETDHAWTLEEVGAQFGVSPERIRQLQAQALATLRRHPLVHSLGASAAPAPGARTRRAPDPPGPKRKTREAARGYAREKAP